MRSALVCVARFARSAPIAAALVVSLAMPSSAFAFEYYAARVPRTASAPDSVGTPRPCITCHNNPDGGQGCETMGGTRPCLNPFGVAFRTNGFRWSRELAELDSDGDGFTNGQELQDPSGSWRPGQTSPGNSAYVTRPGFPTSSPGTTDMDGDDHCWFGRDTNGDGDCTDAGENDGARDCNDSDATVNSSAAEVCSNAIDNDCNGLPTLSDPACMDVVDRDGDGFCRMGRDTNGDRDCIDGAGELTADVDCNDDNVTVFPGARENCADTLDNDCNGVADGADSMCRGDVDNDGDGFCPIGRDVNGDGDCLTVGEPEGGFDCDDTRIDVNPEQTEMCTDGVDNDCNGLADFRDPTCAGFFDGDGDGHCPLGEDTNGDGDCIDAGEADGEPDCDDTDGMVSPSASEVCTNGGDDDCDGLVSLGDPDCAGYLDTDGDRYCFVGFDMNRDGDCADPEEEGGASDCDDTRAEVNPTVDETCTAAELATCGSFCTNSLDDDCDGSLDGFDPGCAMDFRDFDGDGWCGVGPDLNADGDCSDEGEQVGPADARPNDPTVYPGAPENCVDMRDNDQDGMVDEAEYCTRDADADGDGFCPVGRDLNGDGDCLDDDLGENYYASDCDESDVARNPGAEEECFDRRDNDCDGFVDLDDSSCFYLLDRDGDGFCGRGIDDNMDGDCLDDEEDRFGEDCNDTNAAVNVRATEICDNGIDDDCDGAADTFDSQCPCPENHCNDDDPCTEDSCGPGWVCSYTPAVACMDGGVGVDAGMEGGGGGGCGCAAPGAGHTPWGAVLVMVGVGIGALGRRRRR